MVTTLITGGGGDIGGALARRFAARGDRVLVADRDVAAARRVAAAIGESAMAVELDVTDHGSVEREVAAAWTAHGGIDVVVNNAGIGVAGRVEDITVEQWRSSFDVNVLGTVAMMTAVYPRMIASRRGHIVNIASLSGVVATPLLTPYTATKHAVVGLTRAWRIEAVRHGVTIQAVCPGPIDTQMLDRGEHGGVDVRAYLTAAAGRPISADALAESVVAAMARRRAVVVLPARSRAVSVLARLAPGLTDRVVASSAARFAPS